RSTPPTRPSPARRPTRPCSTPGSSPPPPSSPGRKPPSCPRPKTRRTRRRTHSPPPDPESAPMHLLLVALLGLAPADDFYGSIADVKLLKPEDKVDMPSVPPPA